MAEWTPERICEGLPGDVHDDALELAENVAFMRAKLAETRKGIAKQQVVIPYDNGGGQTGIRENPAFKGYHALLASYRKSVDTLCQILRTYSRADAMADSPLAQILAEAEQVLADA